MHATSLQVQQPCPQTLQMLPANDGVGPARAGACTCGLAGCQGPWKVGCGLGLTHLLDEAVTDVEVMAVAAHALDEQWTEIEVHPVGEDDREALAADNANLRRLLLLAANALIPYRRLESSLLGENEPQRVYTTIVEELGDRCPLELQVRLLPRC